MRVNGEKVGDLLHPIFLGQRSNVGGFKPMKIGSMKVSKEIDSPHNILANNIPTMLVKKRS
jgi:hypothetical protein